MEATAWHRATEYLLASDRYYAAAEPGFLLLPLRRFDVRCFLFDQLHEVVDDVGVFQTMVGQAVDVDLMGAVAAAGEADIGFARFARAVDDATDDRHRHRRRDV